MNAFRSALFALAAALALAGARAAEKSSPAFSNLDFPTAGTQAAAEHKLVFVDFYTTWCGPCKMLDESTWQDAAVIALLREKTVALRLDAEKEKVLAQRYKIEAYPTMVLLKPDGTEVDRIVGYLEPAKFIAAFTAALAGKTAGTRAREAVGQAVTPKDKVMARLRLGRQLATEGKPADALTEYLWCYDEGVVQYPEFSAARTSFLIQYIVQLAESYAPAKEALIARRDNAARSIQRPDASSEVMYDYVSLNQALEEESKSLSFYDSLPAGDKRKAALSRPLFQTLLELRRYADLVAGQTYEETVLRLENYKKLPQESTPEANRMTHDFALHSLSDELETYAGANDLAHARELLAGALAFDASADAKTLYRQHLTRAGHPELLPAQP